MSGNVLWARTPLFSFGGQSDYLRFEKTSGRRAICSHPPNVQFRKTIQTMAVHYGDATYNLNTKYPMESNRSSDISFSSVPNGANRADITYFSLP